MKPVLDHGYVELIESWGSDERVIEAARMSTGKGFQGWGSDPCGDCGGAGHIEWQDGPKQCELCQGKGVSVGDEKLLGYLYSHHHDTPFEMAGMVIEVKAPIFIFREWHRHRTQSYNEMSARYIPLPDENYVPTSAELVRRSIEAAATKNRQASIVSQALTLEMAKQDLADLERYYQTGQKLYEHLLNRGWPKELARLPVPVARYSKMRASANLRNWLAFLTLRLSPNAQWEIRQYAVAVGKLVAEKFPRTWALFEKEAER